MTQVWSLKLLCFCFFSGVTAENVYQAMHNFVMQLALRGFFVIQFVYNF